jgi:integrase
LPKFGGSGRVSAAEDRSNVNPKVVSEMPGHASISITLDIYSHLLPDMQEKAAKALEEALR